MISYTAFLNESMNRTVLIKNHRGLKETMRLGNETPLVKT